MRTFNLRLVLWLAGILLVGAVSVHYLHRYQVRRNAGVYLTLATKEDSVARDESRELPERIRAIEDALQHYRRYLALDPHNVQARADYGKLLSSPFVGDYAKAYFQFERVLRAGPKDPKDNEEVQHLTKLQNEIRRLQVGMAMGIRRYSDAIAHLRILLEQAENKDGELLEQLAKCEMRTGKYDLALSTFDNAIKNAPDRLSAYAYKAQLQRDRVRDPAAVNATIEQMITANPQNPDAYLIRAQFLIGDRDPLGEKERLVQATADCAKALELKPDHGDGLALAATCAEMNNKLDEARELLRKSIEVQPGVPQRYLQLARVETRAAADTATALDAGLAIIREGIAAVPEKTRNIDLRWKLADMLLDKRPKSPDEEQELKQLLADLKTEQPNAPLIAFLVARQLMVDEKWTEARQVLEGARAGLGERSEQRSRAERMLGLCYARLGDNDLRLAAVREVLDADPTDINARRDYAEALSNVGQVTEAMRQYDQVLETLRAQGASISVDLYKRIYELGLAATLRQPRGQRNMAKLQDLLNAIETAAPNDPWVPIRRATMAQIQASAAARQSDGDAQAPTAVEGVAAEGQPAEQAAATAKEILEAACTKMPNEQSLWMARLDVARRQEKSDEVDALLSEIETRFGDTVGLRIAKARVLMARKGQEGVPELKALTENLGQIATVSERFQLFAQLADLCVAAGMPTEGLAYGQQAADLVPNNVPIRLTLLQMAQRAKNVKAAQQLLSEIEHIEQGGATTLYSQARYEMTRYAANAEKTANLKAAYEELRQAAEPDQAAVEVAHAKWKESETQDTAALRAARDKLLQAARRRANWTLVPLLLGQIAELQNDENAALAHYRRAIELGSREPTITVKVANILRRRGRTDDADEVLRKLEEQGMAETWEVAWLASQISAEREDYVRALEKVEIPIAAGIESSVFHLFKGSVLGRQRQWQAARESIQAAIQLDPTNDAGYRAMIELLTDEAKEISSLAQDDPTKTELANAKRAEAEKVLALAAENVASDRRAQTIALCRDLLGQPAEAVKEFEAAIEQAPDEPGLLEAAARFYLRHRQLWSKAEPILNRFVNGELTRSGDAQTIGETIRWARHGLASILGEKVTEKDFQQAIRYSDANLAESPNSVADLELRAQLLISRGLPSLNKEAIKVLERRAKIEPFPSLEMQFLQAQLYTALGDWTKGNSLMASVVLAASEMVEQETGDSPELKAELNTYLNTYVESLITRQEVMEAEVWMGVWRRMDPKSLLLAITEARMLVPKRPAEPDAVDSTSRVQEAIDVLDQAVEDPDVKPEQDTKIALAVRTLEDLLENVPDDRTDDAEKLKNAIRNYFQRIIEGNPQQASSRQLMQVRFLVRQGERRQAVELVKQYWTESSVEILITACGALLNFQDELKQISAAERSPQLTPEEREIQTAELMATVTETETVVQQALTKLQQELTTCEESNKLRKKAEVTGVMALLASHYVNTENYTQAIDTYGKMLALQPDNFVATNNRAMILAGLRQDLPTAVKDINDAVEKIGPRPTVVDSQAMILLADGRYAKALEAAQQVMLQKPDTLDPLIDPDQAKHWGGYYYHLAMIYLANRNSAEASKAKQVALSLGFTKEDEPLLDAPAWQKWTAELEKIPTDGNELSGR
ncbi:MAG: tetratricopeptide repeat protein [Pirellulaceae bacterium]